MAVAVVRLWIYRAGVPKRGADRSDLRAGGDITVSNNVTDGFADVSVHGTIHRPCCRLLRVDSPCGRCGSLKRRPRSREPPAPGTLTFGPNAVVRTGNGNIDLVAAGISRLLGAGSGAYTAESRPLRPRPDRRQSLRGRVDSRFRSVMSFPTGGGDCA